jgi:hypothetical protein
MLCNFPHPRAVSSLNEVKYRRLGSSCNSQQPSTSNSRSFVNCPNPSMLCSFPHLVWHKGTSTTSNVQDLEVFLNHSSRPRLVL